MTGRKRGPNRPPPPKVFVSQPSPPPVVPKTVKSLLEIMTDGREYASIAGAVLDDPGKLDGELKSALADLETIRGHPCICYVANPRVADGTSMSSEDALPLAEAVDNVPGDATAVDVFIATLGGSVEVVDKLVDCLRSRFQHVSFLVPAQALSAGTLLCLSGDEIWMDERAHLGPVDPQVLLRDGRGVPLGSLLALIRRIQEDGDARMEAGGQPQWTHIRLLDQMDQKEIGAAMSASDYLVQQSSKYLETYKFKHWATRASTGALVSAKERADRAMEIAQALCDHDRWKSHSHEISRAVLVDSLQVRIEHPENVPGLRRALRRLWALWSYTFEQANVLKATVSRNYVFVRNRVNL